MTDTVKEVVERAKKDPNFLYQLVFNPAEAAKGLRLTEEERTALAANTPERLIGAALARAAESLSNSGSKYLIFERSSMNV